MHARALQRLRPPVAAAPAAQQGRGLPTPLYCSHMTGHSGNLPLYCSSSVPHSSIVVGNGSGLSVHATGHTTLRAPTGTFQLNSVLHAPKLIKNLISVRKFTSDNSCSVEFDPFGFLYEGSGNQERDSYIQQHW